VITSSAAEFGDAVAHGKLAGLDVGTKTVGLAVCDLSWSFAGPSETIRRTKFTADLEALRKFVEREQVTGLVLGLPLNMDGSIPRGLSPSAPSPATLLL
jgi:putative Holliday junction resolvase